MQTLKDHLGLYTDYYELTMAQGYYFSGKKDEEVIFDYYYRTNPYEGGYLIYAGLADVVELLKDFRYTEEDLRYLETTGLHPEFLNWLKDLRFKASIYSVKEGEIVFPNEPLLRIEGNIIEAQLIETLILNILNFQSLIATKAFRVAHAAGGKLFSDFGLRRAHGFGGIHASRAAIIGGASTTSNVYAGMKYGIPVTGTIAHSWIQSHNDELEAFRAYAEVHPEHTVLLVDTYNTIKSGVPNAIKVAKELEEKGHRLIGIRLDSGDLAYLSKKARKMLDAEGLHYVKILASNQLNEYVIKSLQDQKAPIDGFGVGTDLVTGKPEAALDGVYKLSQASGIPRMKISENIEKLTLPGRKKVIRYFDEEGMFYRDGILLEEEPVNGANILYHPHHHDKFTDVSSLRSEELLTKVVSNGELVKNLPSPTEAHQYLLKRASQLPEEHTRFIKPHIYKVGISERIYNLRKEIIKKIKS